MLTQASGRQFEFFSGVSNGGVTKRVHRTMLGYVDFFSTKIAPKHCDIIKQRKCIIIMYLLLYYLKIYISEKILENSSIPNQFVVVKGPSV